MHFIQKQTIWELGRWLGQGTNLLLMLCIRPWCLHFHDSHSGWGEMEFQCGLFHLGSPGG